MVCLSKLHILKITFKVLKIKLKKTHHTFDSLLSKLFEVDHFIWKSIYSTTFEYNRLWEVWKPHPLLRLNLLSRQPLVRKLLTRLMINNKQISKHKKAESLSLKFNIVLIVWGCDLLVTNLLSIFPTYFGKKSGIYGIKVKSK